MRNQRTTRRRTFSVSVARSAWVIGRAGDWLQPAASPSRRRQECRRPATGWHADAVGRARMEMHMVIERRSEAVQKAYGTESWASLARPATVTGRARRSTKQSLYSRDEDPREARDRDWAVSEEAAQSLRLGDHPLPHGHRGNNAIDEMRHGQPHRRLVVGIDAGKPLGRQSIAHVDDRPLRTTPGLRQGPFGQPADHAVAGPADEPARDRCSDYAIVDRDQPAACWAIHCETPRSTPRLNAVADSTTSATSRAESPVGAALVRMYIGSLIP